MTNEGHDGMEALAERLRSAFEAGDLVALAGLLDPDVRWGGEEDTDQTCHNRAEVLARYEALRARGVLVSVTEVSIERDAVVLGLDVTRPGGTEHRRVHQTFTVAGGLVVDIRPGG